MLVYNYNRILLNFQNIPYIHINKYILLNKFIIKLNKIKINFLFLTFLLSLFYKFNIENKSNCKKYFYIKLIQLM